MSSFVISLVFGLGLATWVWSQLARTSGNAHPTQVVVSAAVAGLVAVLVLFTILKGIFNFT